MNADTPDHESRLAPVIGGAAGLSSEVNRIRDGAHIVTPIDDFSVEATMRGIIYIVYIPRFGLAAGPHDRQDKS